MRKDHDYSSGRKSYRTHSSKQFKAVVPYLKNSVLKITSSFACASFLLLSSSSAIASIPTSHSNSNHLSPNHSRSNHSNNALPRSNSSAQPLSIASATESSDQRDTVLSATRTFFQPPSNPRPRTGRQTTVGTRQGSCLNNSDAAPTVLGSSTAIGYTTSARPTLTWYLPPSQDKFPVQIRLLAPNEAGTLVAIHTADLEYIPGYNTYTIPDSAPALVRGVEYGWQMTIECDPTAPSRSIVQNISVQRVVTSPALYQSLLASEDSVQTALSYGEYGIWYDAIAAVAHAQTAAARTIRSGLLRDLAQSENKQTESELTEIQINLLQLAEASDVNE